MAKEEYNAVFKCRLCGETYVERPYVFSYVKMVHTLCEYEEDMSRMLSIHRCEDGSFGISDLQGVKLISKEK